MVYHILPFKKEIPNWQSLHSKDTENKFYHYGNLDDSLNRIGRVIYHETSNMYTLYVKNLKSIGSRLPCGISINLQSDLQVRVRIFD